mgnify:FL=1
MNVYGRSKVEAEEFIKENWPNYAILRSSIIYGPQPFIPVRKTLPIQVSLFLQRKLKIIIAEINVFEIEYINLYTSFAVDT